MQEVWKDVLGLEDYFKVSNKGRVYGKRSGKFLKLQINPNGYYNLATRIGGRQGTALNLRPHILVAQAFLNPPDEDLIFKCSLQGYGNVLVRHLDNNKLNNLPENLAWGTYQDNSDDYAKTVNAYDNCPRGENHGLSKMSDSDVSFAREKFILRDKDFGYRALARKFNVTHETMRRIINRKVRL